VEEIETTTPGAGSRAPSLAEPARVHERSRRIAQLLGVLVTGLLALAILMWWSSQALPARRHWDAVARANSYLRMGQPERAFETVSGIRDEGPGAGEAMTIAGLALIRMGEYRGARLALERAIKLQPNQFEALVGLADLNFGIGNGRRGIEVLEQAARLRPNEFQIWLTMGKVEHDLGNFPRAITAYEKAVQLRPTDREALTGLIRDLNDAGRPQRAAAWAAQALQAHPDDPAILGLGARAAFDSNRLDDAVVLADRALRADPGNAHALKARASVSVARGEWRTALPFAERAAAAPNDHAALQMLENVERKLGLTARANKTRALADRADERHRIISDLARQIDKRPEDPELRWKMAKTAWEGGAILLARRCFEAALALDPNFKPARESLDALMASHPALAQEGKTSISSAGTPDTKTRPSSGVP
jgi:tetratricopeptide (TPR) repeat protein